MKARQSKRARAIFSNETKGRAVIREIHAASKKGPYVVTKVEIDKQHHVLIKEL